MSILVDEKTRVIVQGLGREGGFHAQQCIAYGTQIVGAVKPGKGGAKQDGIPLFDSVDQARRAVSPGASMIFVPPAGAADAILEAADAGIPLVVCITEGIPTFDMIRVSTYLKTTRTRLIGPNCPGINSPGKCKIGIMPGHIHRPGYVGVVSHTS